MGVITFRSVVDLRRNIENTFKNESNYKNKHLKLKNLDEKRAIVTENDLLNILIFVVFLKIFLDVLFDLDNQLFASLFQLNYVSIHLNCVLSL
jgi:hypothetical protein